MTQIYYVRIGTIHEDVTTDVLGKIGVWQWMVTLISTALVIPTIFNYYDDMILLKSPEDVRCVPNYEVANSTLCSYYVASNDTIQVADCEKWYVNFMWLIWIRKKWLIFCDNSMQLLSTTVISRLGLVFGCVIFGVLSDSFGRKIIITISIIADVTFRLAMIFCDSESWFRLLVFLKSLFTSANYYLELVLVCEIASNTWRTRLCLLVSSPRILANVYCVPLANSAPNLDTYNFIAVLFGILPLIFLRWLPESPQWLLYNRKIPNAEKILLNGAKQNNVKLCSEFKIRPVNNRAYECLEEQWTCFTIVSTHNVRVVLSVTLLFWTLFHFVWASLYLKLYNTDVISYNLLQVSYFTLFMGILNFCFAMKTRMRYLLTINIMIMGIISAIAKLCEILKIKNTICDIVSSSGLASGLISYALLLNVTPRLFAVNIRATILGCCYAAGQLGTITYYLISSLQALNNASIMITTLILTSILIAICFIIPDVDGRELPDTIKDMDYFSELSKPLRWATQKTNSPSNEEVEMRVYSFSSAENIATDSEHASARAIGFVRWWNNLRLWIGHMRKKCENKS